MPLFNMTTALSHLMLIAFFISCALINLSSCYPNPSMTSTSTAVFPSSTQVLGSEASKKMAIRTAYKKRKEYETQDELEAVRRAKEKAKKAKEKAKEKARKAKNKSNNHKQYDDDDDDDYSYDDYNDDDYDRKPTSKQYKNHQTKFENGDDDDYRDKNENSHSNSKDENHAASSTPSTNTVVTTIIVVSTQTPTNIYTGSSNGSAKQKGDSSKNHNVDDPNDSTSSATDSDSDTSSSDNPDESAIAAAMLHDQSAYHKLVTALSIVGGIAGVALFAGGLVFTRMKLRKRRRKETDSEKAENHNDNDHSNNNANGDLQSSLPPRSRASLPSPHYDTRFSNDGDDTVIDFSEDPFSDPADLSHSKNMIRSLDHRMALAPSGPPSLPLNLESSHRYTSYRQNQTLSMISQTTAAALPSAPSAKELGALEYDNPFNEHSFDITEEDEQGCQQLSRSHHHHHRYHSSLVTSIAPSSIIAREDTSQQQPSVSAPGSSPSSPCPVSSERPFHLRIQQESQESFSTADLPPPPAYTPSATPSAPPLYALPASRQALEAERQQQQQQQHEENSRRHSISSCSINSSSRPLSLRRGSGSLALISFK